MEGKEYFYKQHDNVKAKLYNTYFVKTHFYVRWYSKKYNYGRDGESPRAGGWGQNGMAVVVATILWVPAAVVAPTTAIAMPMTSRGRGALLRYIDTVIDAWIARHCAQKLQSDLRADISMCVAKHVSGQTVLVACGATQAPFLSQCLCAQILLLSSLARFMLRQL